MAVSPAPVRLRQVVIAARDLDQVVSDLCAVLDLEEPYRDPAVAAFGLRNAVMPAGDTFIEVVSPIAPDAAAGRFLERRGDDGGYMIMLQTQDVIRRRSHVAERGVRIAWGVDLDDMIESHLHPADLSGAIVALSAPNPPDSWKWGGPLWRETRRSAVVRRVVGVELASADPEPMAARWGDVLEVEVKESEQGPWIALDEGALSFGSAPTATRDSIAGYVVETQAPDIALKAAQMRGLPVESRGGRPAVRIGGTWLVLGVPAACS